VLHGGVAAILPQYIPGELKHGLYHRLLRAGLPHQIKVLLLLLHQQQWG
jgi:hypothetical protein